MAAVDGTADGFDIERLIPSFDLISGINEMISPPLCLYPLFGVNRRLSLTIEKTSVVRKFARTHGRQGKH